MEKGIVRQEEEFGKDFGLIHEVVVTGRKAGATKEFWAKLAHDENLFCLVIKQVLSEEGWLENILARERQCHRDFFDREFDLSEFKKTLQKYGQKKIMEWQKFSLEPHFLPEVIISQDANFRGWKIKLESWFWQKIAKGGILRQAGNELVPIKEVRLDGISVLIDTRLKPAYNAGRQMYKNDNLLGPVIERLREAGRIAKYEFGPQYSRFGVSADEWESYIKPALAEKLGLEASQLRLERFIEANTIPQIYSSTPRKSDGGTDTWVWYEEYFGGRAYRLSGGYSHFGGLAAVRYDSSGDHWRSRSFRPLAVL